VHIDVVIEAHIVYNTNTLQFVSFSPLFDRKEDITNITGRSDFLSKIVIENNSLNSITSINEKASEERKHLDEQFGVWFTLLVYVCGI